MSIKLLAIVFLMGCNSTPLLQAEQPSPKLKQPLAITPPLITSNGTYIRLIQTAKKTWKAYLTHNCSTDTSSILFPFSRCLPVIFVNNIKVGDIVQFSSLHQRYQIHILDYEKKGKKNPYVYIGAMGLLGGGNVPNKHVNQSKGKEIVTIHDEEACSEADSSSEFDSDREEGLDDELSKDFILADHKTIRQEDHINNMLFWLDQHWQPDALARQEKVIVSNQKLINNDNDEVKKYEKGIYQADSVLNPLLNDIVPLPEWANVPELVTTPEDHLLSIEELSQRMAVCQRREAIAVKQLKVGQLASMILAERLQQIIHQAQEENAYWEKILLMVKERMEDEPLEITELSREQEILPIVEESPLLVVDSKIEKGVDYKPIQLTVDTASKQVTSFLQYFTHPYSASQKEKIENGKALLEAVEKLKKKEKADYRLKWRLLTFDNELSGELSTIFLQQVKLHKKNIAHLRELRKQLKETLNLSETSLAACRIKVKHTPDVDVVEEQQYATDSSDEELYYSNTERAFRKGLLIGISKSLVHIPLHIAKGLEKCLMDPKSTIADFIEMLTAIPNLPHFLKALTRDIEGTEAEEEKLGEEIGYFFAKQVFNIVAPTKISILSSLGTSNVKLGKAVINLVNTYNNSSKADAKTLQKNQSKLLNKKHLAYKPVRLTEVSPQAYEQACQLYQQNQSEYERLDSLYQTAQEIKKQRDRARRRMRYWETKSKAMKDNLLGK